MFIVQSDTEIQSISKSVNSSIFNVDNYFHKGTRILQHPCHSNPIRENRCPTNTRFAYVFIFIVLLWLAIGIQALARGPTNKFDNAFVNDKDDFFFILYRCVDKSLLYLSPPMETFDKVFLFSLFFGGLSVFNCIILIRIFTRPFLYISLLVFALCLLAQIGSLVILILNLVINILDIFTLVYLSICVTYTFTVLFCAYKVGLKTLCEIVKNSTRAIIDCPATLFFTFAIVTLEILVVVFVMNAFKIILSSNDSTFWIVSFSLIIIAGGIVISGFIILFAMAVISEYTVNWFWMTKEISFLNILQSIAKIFRNHAGTIALESTLIIPFTYAIARAIKYRNKTGRLRNCGNIYIDSVARATLVCSIVHSALVHTSIYGSNFAKATKKTMRLVISNPYLYLATIEIYNMIAVIGLIGNTVGMFFTAYAMVRLKHIPVHNMPLPFFWGFYIPVIAYCILMSGVGRALLMNKMIILSSENDYKESAEII